MTGIKLSVAAALSLGMTQPALADSAETKGGLTVKTDDGRFEFKLGGRFHIDAYGMLQLCSGNRRAGYDLRKGSFREGFYEVLPTFGCPWKSTDLVVPLQPAGHHG